jgi:hypothetical protein
MVGASFAVTAALSYSSVATGTWSAACGQGGGGPMPAIDARAASARSAVAGLIVRYSSVRPSALSERGADGQGGALTLQSADAPPAG